MFDVFYIGNKPNLFAHEQLASSIEEASKLSRTRLYWCIYSNCDYSNFDFTYVPAPWEEQFVHVWPTAWHQFGGAFLCNKETVQNQQYYFHKTVVDVLPTEHNWNTLHKIESFDYTWHPHPFDPPYIYVFGNQWYGPEQMPTVEYHMPGATTRKYLYEPQACLPVTQENWVVNSDIPVEFDFSWCPDPHDPPYIYVFGNQHWAGERSSTIEYHVPGATERKFVDNIQAKLSSLDIFFIDKLNPQAQSRFNKLQEKYPHIQKIRHANSLEDTMRRCATRSKTARFWAISSENNYSNFNFDWQPEPWQHHMTHVFPSQWNKWSDTYLISKWEFERHIKWATKIEQFPNLNFVETQQVQAEDDGTMIYYIDHGNDNTMTVDTLQARYPKLKVTRFVDNYLDTFKRIISVATTEYVWIINSVCDYTTFDFSWTPEPWQSDMIHVFASKSASGNELQKYGDTFYINVESFKNQMHDLELLDWFNVINYCNDQVVPRLPVPVVYYQQDSVVEAIKEYNFNFPYALFCSTSADSSYIHTPMCLWRSQTRIAQGLNSGNSAALIPKDVKTYIGTQVYDYPYVARNQYIDQHVPDVIFISNGESMAEENWNILKAQCPRAKRSDGVTGRELAYKTAAQLSATPWFYAVFAKTEVLPTFNFDYQPDYFQQPKHYIFHSRNPLNGLEYGAMNVNLYNRQLVLDTDPGLDFTLSQAHDVVPVCISISRFNTDPWITWRSAFREVLKLKREVDLGTTLEIEYRLNTWCTVANGENAEYCLQGARDALGYYAEVGGNYEALKLSFDWAWCQEYYYKKYNRELWLEVGQVTLV